MAKIANCGSAAAAAAEFFQFKLALRPELTSKDEYPIGTVLAAAAADATDSSKTNRHKSC